MMPLGWMVMSEYGIIVWVSFRQKIWLIELTKKSGTMSGIIAPDMLSSQFEQWHDETQRSWVGCWFEIFNIKYNKMAKTANLIWHRDNFIRRDILYEDIYRVGVQGEVMSPPSSPISRVWWLIFSAESRRAESWAKNYDNVMFIHPAKL